VRYLIILLITVLMSSCAILDYPKRIAGYSIENFKQEKKGRFSFNVELEPKKAYNKCNLFLFENNIRVNFKNPKKNYIVASRFSLIYEYTLDSTEVAFFISEIDENNSEIEVISNNSRLAKFVYNKLKTYMDN
jgi:hypothetical protein